MSYLYSESLKADCDAYFTRNKGSEESFNRSTNLDVLRKYLKEEDEVLEVGCGDGKKVNTLTEGLGTTYTGIDISGKAIEAAKERFPNYCFKQSKGVRIDFDAGVFDFVYLGFFLYLLDRAHLALLVSEVDRVLKDGGILAITDFGTRVQKQKKYSHDANLDIYKFNYASIFDAFPQYAIVEKCNHFQGEFNQDDDTWEETTILSKKHH